MENKENEPKKDEQKSDIPKTRPLADNEARPGYKHLNIHTQKKTPDPVNEALQNSEESKLKKKHGLRTFIIVVLALIVAVVIAIAATGLYIIPGVSSVFGADKPKDLGVYPSEQALTSLESKISMQIKSERRSYDNVSDIFIGSAAFEEKTTDEEITSFLDRFQGSNSPFSDTQVKFIEGGMEISSMVDYKIKAPAYAKVMVSRSSENSIDLTLTEGRIGFFSVPEKYLSQAEEYFEDKINSTMAEISGFSMKTLEYHDGYSNFNGTFPEIVYSNDKGWSALLID